MKLKSLVFALCCICASCAFAGDPGFNEADRCHSCSMVITKYPGPKGIVVLNDGSQLKFCSTREAYCYARKEENKSNVKAILVHDAGKTDWAEPEDAKLTDGTKAVLVYGTKKRAVMGPAVAPFGSREDAEKFIGEFGGTIYEFEEITPELLGCRK